MHEWALAEAVIAAAEEASEKEKLKEITEVRVKVGELQQVELDILEFALSQLKTDKFKSVKFKIETAKAELKCRSPDFEIIEGRGVWLESIKGAK
jgi:hydrogenase nickel incorporation protein HypA/HybF